MLPQELIQMHPARLLVLRAGLPPVRGRKIIYWRERAFTSRVLAPPVVPPRKVAAVVKPSTPVTHSADDNLTLDLVIPALNAAGLEPLPKDGASEAEVEAWVERFIDASVRPTRELDHA